MAAMVKLAIVRGCLAALALLITAILALVLAGSCKQVRDDTAKTPAKPAVSATGAIISDREAMGFNIRIGAAYNVERLCKQLEASRIPVDVAEEDADARMIPGTVGDGTVYFWVTPDPRDDQLVGGVTIGVDINTALQLGKLSRPEFERLIREARAEAEKRPGSAPQLAKYSAAEALLAARRNPGVKTDAGVGLGSTKQEVIEAYGEAKDMQYISGDTIRIYRGPKVAVALRLSDDVVRQIIVFPPSYDYAQFTEETQAMLKGEPTGGGGKIDTPQGD